MRHPATSDRFFVTRENEKIKSASTKPFLSKDSVRSAAHAIQDRCNDLVLGSDGVHMLENGRIQLGSQEPSRMSPYALGQLCTKLGIPTRYAYKCLTEGESELFADTVNTWFEHLKSPLLYRTFSRENTDTSFVRGVLSNRFTAFDAPEVVDTLFDTLPKSFKVKQYLLNEERMHIRLLDEKLDIPDEDLFIGIMVDSSDVGRSTLVMKFFVYKQVCTNGLVVSQLGATLFSQKHIGLTTEEFCNGIRLGVDRMPEVAQATAKAITSARKTLTPVELSALEKRFMDVSRSSDDTLEKLRASMEHYDRSRWGFTNAVTEVAQNYTLERRIELENLAGDAMLWEVKL